jgi:DNA recombination protein RmuC
MEYVIIGLLILLVIFSISKNINESNITERLGRLETSLVKELGEFKNDVNNHLNDNFEKMNEKVERKLNLINDRVNERLDENFEKTNKTFTSVIERLSKIDEAQKKIEGLSTDIVSLQSILTDKKTRGIFGEVNLKHIMASVFGEKNDNIYKMQYTFDTGVIADCVLFAPKPLGTIAIDSKFPLENYRIMIDKKAGALERQNAEKLFKQDVKKHIDAIANKYIIKGVTSDQAIMFLPAEALFAELNAYHPDIIDYAYKKRVWIASPTTLMSTLTTIELVIKNIEKDKYTSIIHDELNKLSVDFGRYKERWNKLSRSIEAVSRDANDIHITTDKISKRFEAINNVDTKELNSDKIIDNVLK